MFSVIQKVDMSLLEQLANACIQYFSYHKEFK